MQSFTIDQQHYIQKGRLHRDTLRGEINRALNNNVFNSNYIIQSSPGLGKTYETTLALSGMETKPLVIRGSTTLASFGVDLAMAIYLAKGKRIAVVCDDCDSMFEAKNINTFKGMFDDKRTFSYNKNIRAAFSSMSDLEVEAVQHFMEDDRRGYHIPVHNVTFVILTNIRLPEANDVENAKTLTKRNELDHLHAIRRRCEYKSISMTREDLWGYIADVVMNSTICEKFMPSITVEQKTQLLYWCFVNWDRMVERNLSIVEKMTKKIVEYPTNYLDVWEKDYLSEKGK